MTTPEPSTRFTAEQVRAVEADIRKLNALSGGEEHEIADMLDAFADLLEARAARPSPWQPIETAPKDGTVILGGYWFRQTWIAVVVRWTKRPTGDRWEEADTVEARPSQWQPIIEPSPPAQDGGRP